MVDRTNAAESVVTPSESIPPVRAVVRAIEILMSFTAETPELSLSELTRKVQMPKSTVYRLLLTLEQHKFIERTGQDRFRLGSALIVLGQLALNSRDLLQLALQPMQALRDRTGESVHLHILDANERLCIHTIQGTHDLRTVGGVGQRSPLHVGASARAILAFMPEAEREKIIQAPLRPWTRATIVDPDVLRKELASVRDRGVAVSCGERDEGIASIAAPIFNGLGEVVGSISLSGPAHRITAEHIEAYSAAVKETALELSRQLGFVPLQQDT